MNQKQQQTINPSVFLTSTPSTPVELTLFLSNGDQINLYFHSRTACVQFISNNLQRWIDWDNALAKQAGMVSENYLCLGASDEGTGETPYEFEFIHYEGDYLFCGSKQFINHNRIDFSLLPDFVEVGYSEDLEQSDQEWNSEFAMQAGMGMGVDAYNDAIGSSYEPYDPALHDPEWY
jgi:hypothetical protein